MKLEEIEEDPANGDPEDWRFVRCLMPTAVVAASDEALELYRAVEGHEASIAGFAEALAADAMAGPSASDIEFDVRDLNRVEGRATIERALAHSTDNWSHLPEAGQTDWALALAGASLGSQIRAPG